MSGICNSLDPQGSLRYHFNSIVIYLNDNYV